MSLFQEYRNHRVIALRHEIGEPINCFYATEGLPNKVLYHPQAEQLLSGQEDETADPLTRMLLIAPEGGNKLQSYLTEKLGMVNGVDFERHGNGYRGGLLYFDVTADSAVGKILARAEEVGQASATEREDARPAPSPWGKRP